jgi:hypothetical protein
MVTMAMAVIAKFGTGLLPSSHRFVSFGLFNKPGRDLCRQTKYLTTPFIFNKLQFSEKRVNELYDGCFYVLVWQAKQLNAVTSRTS